MALRWTLTTLIIFCGSLVLWGKEPPAGMLIIKSDANTPESHGGNVIEFQTITEHLIPATDFITITKPNGERDDIPKNVILRKVEYPKQLNQNILSEGGLNSTLLFLKDFQSVVAQYPQAHKYLDSKIFFLQKEVDLFRLGSRKVNGEWVSEEDFQALLAREHERRLALIEAKRRVEAEAAEARRKEEEAIAEAKRTAEEQAAAEAKRIADEKAALEAKKKAEENLKKVKAALLNAEKSPPPSPWRYIHWYAMGLVFIVGVGGLVVLRIIKGPRGPTSISELDWPKFELLVAEIYRRRGFAVEISSGFGAEVGLDVKLTRDGETVLVLCKHWTVVRNYKVGAQEIESLYEKVENEPGQQGIFVSTGEFTPEAKEFAEGKPIQLMGVADIEKLIPHVSRNNENILNVRSWIRNFVANVKIVDPRCPKCAKPMLLITAPDGTPGWKCPDSPVCEGKLDARVDLVRKKRV